jgi:mono/diheme cytochrome c family protein
MDDFRKILYGVIIGFIAVIVGWVSFLTYSGCGFSLNNCNASVPKIQRTSIPSLVPATLPIPTHSVAPMATHLVSRVPTQIILSSPAPTNPVSTSAPQTPAGSSTTASLTVASSTATSAVAAGSSSGGVPRPSNPGGPSDAVNLTGDPNSGQQIFAANCVLCHNTAGKGGNPNPGSAAGTIPALNPINPALKSSDHMTFVTNLDLFVQHGSTPAGPGPTFSMPPWGDSGKLTQKQIADVIAYVISLNP